MSAEIQTFVFFDVETTGLPWQEGNRTKIIEMSFVAANRDNILACSQGELPPVEIMTTLLNPQRAIHPDASTLTGITNDMVRNAPTFKEYFIHVKSFFMSLKQPICVVAHNGNVFDYKILLAECVEAGVGMTIEVLCVDSLVGFRRVLKATDIPFWSSDWPPLEMGSGDWDEIDQISKYLSDIATVTDIQEDAQGRKRKYNKAISKKRCYNLSSLYQNLLSKKRIGAHRAENDCIVLLECFIASKNILAWADENCKLLKDIVPLKRYLKPKIK